MFGRSIALSALLLLTLLVSTDVGAIEFRTLECAPVPSGHARSYNLTVPCTAVVRRGTSGMWYNAPAQECSSFCRAIGSENVASPDGFRCTSGEERPWSAIGVVNYAPTGCWHDCRLPEGRLGAVSFGPWCYAPGQKRDNDRTDTTVGCYCATGDIHSDVIDIGIHTSGTAQSFGVSHWVSGLSSITAAAMNDRPGRVSYIRGGISLSGEAVVHFTVNIRGACGSSIAMSGRTNGSGGTISSSSEVILSLPSCGMQCSVGAYSGQEGATDTEDGGCVGVPDDPEDDGEVEAPCQAPVDQTVALTSLETLIRAQRVVVYELVDPLISATADPALKARALELRALADTIKRDLVRDMHRQYPKSTLWCPTCPTRDLATIKAYLIRQSRKMLRLTRQVSKFVRSATPGLGVRASLQTADSLFQKFRAAADELPGGTSECVG